MTEPLAKKKHKPRRGLGQALTRKRRHAMDQVNEQREKRIAREKQAAREELARLKNRDKNEAKNDGAEKWASSLLRATIANQTALLRVWGHSQSVTAGVEDRSNVMAYTDFKRIVIKWPKASVPNRLNRKATADCIAQIKGVMQHEMGHIRFTVPWNQVLSVVGENTTPHPAGLLHKCWNMLEDQRMESLVVETVPRIANYFGTMVANVVLANTNMEQSWLMLAGRAYLPNKVLRQSYIMFDEFCEQQGITDGALTWFNLVQDYRAAATEKALHDAVVAAYEFIQDVRATMPEAMDSHDSMDESENDLADSARGKGNITDMFDEKPKKSNKKSKKSDDPGSGGDSTEEQGDGQGDQGDDQGDGDEGEGSGSGKGDEEADSSDGSSGEGDEGGSDEADSPGQSNTGDGSETTHEEEFKEALDEALNEFDQGIQRDSDINDIMRDAQTRGDATGLPEYPNEAEAMSPDLQERAKLTARGIENALNSFVTDAAPQWHVRQDTGVIDALAYRTKQVGATDYRRLLHDDGNIGLDVHVSMLCDVSGSMGWGYGGASSPITALSESLYATALACQNLGIGSTFTLWSSGNQNYRVWADGQPTPTLWPCMGGTDPLTALDDLDGHNPEGAKKHLVIIFTDGAWAGGFPSLRQWDAPDRHIVLVRYGSYEGEVQKDMGAHSHIHINDVSALPKHLTDSLMDVLAQGDF